MAKLFVITGPSGVGKDSIIRRLVKIVPRMRTVVTTTTRPMRSGESQTRPYHFVSREEFNSLRVKGAFLEWANVYGEWYGTPREEVARLTGGTQPVVLKIDIQGARAVKKSLPDTICIFVAPAHLEELAQRISRRNSESDEQKKRRLMTAELEMKHLEEWDEVVYNRAHELDAAVQEIAHIMSADENKTKHSTPAGL